MRILLEAHHPAHIHFWKYPVRELIERGHEVLMIGRDRDVMRRLLEVYDWIPSEIPKRKTGKNKFPMVEMLQRQWTVAKAIRRFQPDVVASLMGSYTQSAKLLGVRNLIFTDSEFQHFNHRIAHPFADEIYTPECFYKELGPRQIKYDGMHELLFLGREFDRSSGTCFMRYPGLHPQRYILIRMSAWNTLHDIGHAGFGSNLQGFIDAVPESYRIIISAEESELPDSLKRYAMPLRPEDFHAVLAHAAFVLTEGASTASEAACLGVSTVYINNTEPRGYLNLLEQEYGLVRGFSDVTLGMACAQEMIQSLSEVVLHQHQVAAERLLAKCPNLVDFVVKVLLRGSSESHY
ncbi:MULTISPECIES: DUF354 domain-containing protein [unclassified Lentimonas]|uniref:DUF354 domain-containing protein n=1 Tax=unclassified Lentimonas TaxID=2630993 RepID=UPI001321A68C|nr:MULTISPECIES: DUF354 domain-containing protein [unclassified Lentimonas]CAA6676530.1 Unannotated [Lentimonas sp. CC4]CAA6685370.1 Unannotated [Lentimonas sp. CC6]CAA7074906.1 Unannotated [Lentimonas sp. CC4]CAA7169531.1 Unannotated [Lentimonas sp. CC21]CAA7182706.1 Unannotated [Lentimonas sp. CC8]